MIDSNIILVVQHGEDQRTHTCEALQDKGYQTIGVGSVADAVAFLTGCCGNVRLVLTEYQLPDFSGYELKLKLQELPGIKRMPIVFLDKHINPFLHR
jgi:two-component system, chemotaxis family, chemotaxis protein CheY